MATFCIKCGAQSEGNERFCGKCGNDLTAAPAAVPAAAPPAGYPAPPAGYAAPGAAPFVAPAPGRVAMSALMPPPAPAHKSGMLWLVLLDRCWRRRFLLLQAASSESARANPGGQPPDNSRRNSRYPHREVRRDSNREAIQCSNPEARRGAARSQSRSRPRSQSWSTTGGYPGQQPGANPGQQPGALQVAEVPRVVGAHRVVEQTQRWYSSRSSPADGSRRTGLSTLRMLNGITDRP